MYRKAVANMIHELADGAQFITTTFRFVVFKLFQTFTTETQSAAPRHSHFKVVS